MAPRSLSTATIGFGLVSIPVRVHAATVISAGVSFHLLHGKDGIRLRQQLVCPKDEEVVSRKEAVKGFEFEKDRYVTFSDKELKALDENATHGIEINEFVPLASVDPRYFERTYYLSPGKGGDKAFSLLVRALEDLGLAAVGEYAARGKGYLVALRPAEGRLIMQQLLHADEVKPLEQVPAADAQVKPAELKLARDLIERLTSERFDPERYSDKVRARIRELIERKVEGREVTEAPSERPRAQVIDLMSALKASLERRKGDSGAAPRRSQRRPRARTLPASSAERPAMRRAR